MGIVGIEEERERDAWCELFPGSPASLPVPRSGKAELVIYLLWAAGGIQLDDDDAPPDGEPLPPPV